MFGFDFAFASGTFTQGGQPSASDTIEVGSVEYTWRASASAPGDVQIGATAEGSLDNLIAAINGDALNAPNPEARAVKTSATVATVFAKVAGSVGNHVPFDESSDNYTASGDALLAGGDGDIGAFLQAILDFTQVDSEQFHLISEVIHVS